MIETSIENVLTLSARPDGLDDAIVAAAVRALKGLGLEPAPPDWLAPGEAVDIPFNGTAPKTAERAAKGVMLNPGSETLVRTMTAHGAHAALVSGGFRYFGEAGAAMAGFDEVTANRFDFRDGRLSGRATEPIGGPEAKLDTLTRLSRERGIPMAETMAIGDGANDVPMIRAAGLGIAFHAKPVARQAARARGASIDHTDLTAALFMQGYRRDEFAG